jgi:hypothetical protein
MMTTRYPPPPLGGYHPAYAEDLTWIRAWLDGHIDLHLIVPDGPEYAISCDCERASAALDAARPRERVWARLAATGQDEDGPYAYEVAIDDLGRMVASERRLPLDALL